jgi:predicted nuclease of predicted toxin-antitoxin system
VSAEIRFHLDECVPTAIADGLRRRGIDVTTSQEEGLLQSMDESQLGFASRQGRVLITQDADFLRLHRLGAVHQGIVYYDPADVSIGRIIQGLVLIHGVLPAEEMAGHLEFLSS